MVRRAWPFAVLAAALIAAGCGAEGLPDTANTSNGQQLFTENCGSCHTLAAAGTRGRIGPNLDEAFRRSREDGLGQNTIAGVVRNMIAYPITDPANAPPESGMPADLVTGQDADDVAAFVASVAGVEGAAPPAEARGGGGTTAEGDGGGEADGDAVFASAGCGTCHTFEPAGSTGTVGPNLDESKPSKELAVDRVTNGSGAMPPFEGQLSEAQIDAVAEFVSGG